MNVFLITLSNFFKKIIFLILPYIFTRLIFFIFNYNYFIAESTKELIRSFLWGLRFDLWVIILFNFPFLILLPLSNKKFFSKTLKVEKIYLTFVNSLLLLTNLIDIEYFKYTHKRSTADLINLIFTGSDVWILLPTFIIDFWYIVVFWILLILYYLKVHKFLTKDIIKNIKTFKFSYSRHIYFYSNIFLFYLIILAFSFLVLRGTKLKPINILSANLHASYKLSALTLNTPFSIIKTFGKNFENYTIKKIPTNLYHLQYIKNDTLVLFKKKPNIIVLILESFSKDFIGYFNKNSIYTKFLDSLLQNSLVFEHSFANGRRSIDCLPSLLASIPALDQKPYKFSVYSSNELTALPMILNKMGYSTYFFHGGRNGTMGFDVFTATSGITYYYGKDQYPNKNDYDGNWGIWDEPFLQFSAEILNNAKTPFFAIIYTLSSHHPYKIPEKYKSILPDSPEPILKSIAYTDISLKKFFHKIKNYEWFKNSLFIITADHNYASSNFSKTPIGSFAVPIALYSPNTDINLLKNYIKNTYFQHIDIYPTLCWLLNFNDTIVSFGKNIFDKTKNNFAIFLYDNNFYYLKDSFVIVFNNDNFVGFYNYLKDSFLKENLITNYDSSMINTYKEHILNFLDNYFFSLNNNLTSLKTIKLFYEKKRTK